MADPLRILQPLLLRVLEWEARRMQQRFRHHLDRLAEVQSRTLLEKVRRNAKSDFGRDHDFAAIRSVDDFRRAMPVTTYADYVPYIERVRHGQFGAMLGPGQKVHMFAMTSGTTNQPKYVPVSDAFLREYRRSWMIWGIHAFLAHPAAFEGRILQIVSAMDDERAPCGLHCGAMSGLTAQVQRRATRNFYVLPSVAAGIKHTPSKYYVALLLSLRQHTLTLLSANPSTLLGLARTLDERKEELLRDLRDGTLTAAADLPMEVRFALRRELRPEPERAGQVERAVSSGGRLLPKDVWRLPLLGCWKGGTLSLYLREFQEFFGDAVVRDIGLIASEGRMTIPLDDVGSAGPLDAESTFFEFLPSHQGEREGTDTLLPHQLEVGREYFLLLTTSAGLYRYDIGDVVRVEGFLGGSPLLTFLNKGAHYSSLTGEKLSEHQAVESVNAALAETGFALSSYCLAPTWSAGVPFYSLLVEADQARDAAALGRFVETLDGILRRVNIEYEAKRSSGRLASVRPKVIATGSWHEYDLKVIADRRRGIEQYKHKFLVNDVEFEKQFPVVS